MKKHYTPLLCLIATCAMAQTSPFNLPLHPEGKHDYHAPAVRGERGAPKGTSYYSETFDNDLNGWTVTSDVGTVVWHWTDVGPGPTSSTYPVPPLNTTAGWAMFDDDYEGGPGLENESSLVSPVIDLSSAPANLSLSFDQYYQVFDEDLVDVWIGVSTDGTNWTETLINDGVGRDGRPNPEAFDLNISDPVSANPATVQIRFRYAATWDYGWQVDNIAIKELSNNDMALLNAYSTTFDFTTTGPDAQPYTIYPQAHLVPMDAHGQIKNKGFLPQTNVITTMSITGPGGDDFTATAGPQDVAPEEVADVFFDSFEPNGNLGTYEVNFTITQDQVDEAPANNSLSNTFEVSSGIYALDHGAVDQFQRQAPDEMDESFEVGSKFQFQTDDEIIAVQVAIHEATPVGGVIYGAVYELALADEHPSLLSDFTTEHTIEASELNPMGGSTFITMTFVNPVPIAAGETVQVMAGVYEGSDSVRFATSGTVPSQIALIHYPNLAADFLFTFTKAPMVRAVLASGSIGIAETDGRVSVVSAGPNPFTDNCDLRFELSRSANVEVELHDVTGRLVSSEHLGDLGAGPQVHRISGDALGEGLYLYSVIIDGARYTGKIEHRN